MVVQAYQLVILLYWSYEFVTTGFLKRSAKIIFFVLGLINKNVVLETILSLMYYFSKLIPKFTSV